MISVKARTYASFRCKAILAFVLLASSQWMWAQSVSIYSSIVGTVTDPSGSAIPDAQVVATNISTNISTSVKTDGAGFYRVDRLVLGTYQIVTTRPGFKELKNEGIALSSGQTMRVDFSLQVGAVDQSVTVRAE